MKKCMVFIFIILFPALLFADGEYFLSNSMTKKITAYKNTVSGNIPQLSVSLRLFDPSQTEFTDVNHEIDIPSAERGRYSAAFSWIIAGNAFSTLKLKFSFWQMSLLGVQQSSNTKYIPYDIKLVYGTSRVGNSSLQINTESTASSYVTNNFTGTTYRFFYADSISGASSQLSSATAVNVDSSKVETTVTYNMSTKTKVANSSGNFGNNNQYKTAYTTAVGSPAVCDYWNRSGTAYALLKIENVTNDEAGRVRWSGVSPDIYLDDGKYYATVKVEVSLE